MQKNVANTLGAKSLAPVTTSTTAHALGQPEGLVVVSVGTSGALAVVAVLVEEATTLLRALGDTLAVDVSVDIDAGSRALEKALILDGPSDNVDLDVGVGEVVEAVEPLEPLVVLRLEKAGNLLAVGGTDGLVRLPSDAHVQLALAGDELVPTVVLEAHGVRVGLEAVVPDLLEGGGEVRGGVPSGLALGGTVAGEVLPRCGRVDAAEALPNGSVKVGLGGGALGCGRRSESHKAGSRGETHDCRVICRWNNNEKRMDGDWLFNE